MNINRTPNPKDSKLLSNKKGLVFSQLSGQISSLQCILFDYSIVVTTKVSVFYIFAWGIACSHGKDLKSALPHSVFFFFFFHFLKIKSLVIVVKVRKCVTEVCVF